MAALVVAADGSATVRQLLFGVFGRQSVREPRHGPEHIKLASTAITSYTCHSRVCQGIEGVVVPSLEEEERRRSNTGGADGMELTSSPFPPLLSYNH